MVDASVVLDALVLTGQAGQRARDVVRDGRALHVPAMFAAEVASGLRRLAARRWIEERSARVALNDLQSFRTIEYAFTPFAKRVWSMRENLTVYDAWYVALAESLGVTLWTADRRLASAPGPRCSIELISRA